MGFVDRYVVPEAATLEQAMRCIDQSDGTIALITSGRRLVGLVTNGDIRRAILQGSALSRPVREVMNRTPVLLRRREINELPRVSEVLLALEETATNLLPVVDDEGNVVDLLVDEDVEVLRSRALRRAQPTEPTRKRILLIGGAGYIGSVLAPSLLTEGFAVRVADRLLYGRESIESVIGQPHYEFTRCDIRHIEHMIDLVTDVHAVVYLAEIVGDPACAVAPRLTLETNFISVFAFATLCSHLQINRFIYLSSCSVYGASQSQDDGAWLDEDAPLHPLSLYAQMKANTESALLVLAKEHPNLCPTILRLGTVFGHSPRPRFDLVVNRMTAHAVREGVIPVCGGDQWRPTIHVGDVARAIVAVLRSPVPLVSGRVFNVGDNRMNLRIRDLGESVAREVPGAKVQIRTDGADRRNYRVSFDRVRSVLGFETRTTLREGIAEVSHYLTSSTVDFRLPQFNNFDHLELNARAEVASR